MKRGQVQLKGAFDGCSWCYGRGCLQCDEQRRKWEERQMEPMFVADTEDPEDMRDLREFLGGEALQKAFGPGGGGVSEVRQNAALASLRQFFRKSSSGE